MSFFKTGVSYIEINRKYNTVLGRHQTHHIKIVMKINFDQQPKNKQINMSLINAIWHTSTSGSN